MNDCNISAEIKSIPKDYSGSIINDLSNSYYGCAFNSVTVNYKICIHLGVSNTTNCYQDPCGDRQIYTTRCNGTTQTKVSLDVDEGTENGTVISIFCPVNGKETLLFNIGICKFIFKIITMTNITLCTQ